MIRAISLSTTLDELREVGRAIGDQKDQINETERLRLRRLYRRQQNRIRRRAGS